MSHFLCNQFFGKLCKKLYVFGCKLNLPSLNYKNNVDLILEQADDKSLKGKARDELIDKLHNGVFLDNQKQKFWVDIITSANSFELYARDLSIDLAEEKQYWNWTSMKDTNGVQMEMADLVSVRRLDMKKNFPIQMLTPGTSYEISFVLKMKEVAKGFENNPVKLKLVLPNREQIERTEDLSYMPREKWKEIRVGEFVTSCDMSGTMEISMCEHDDKTEKKGLVINKIIIRPTTWKVFSGEKNWDGLVNPLNVVLNKYITFYGERVDAICDSINEDETSPTYGYPKYEEEELFSKVGLDKDNKGKIYEVKKYIKARIDVPPLLELIRQDRSTWIGYVAVATDYGVKVLGRRDILVCWRGTSSDAEWIKNLQFLIPTHAQLIFPKAAAAKVHRGFYSIYTTPDSASGNKSARDQVLEEVWTWVDHYKNEEASISVIGHSLGAALATINAADIVLTKTNMPTNNPNETLMVTAFGIASPRVGNLRFQSEFNKLIIKAKLRLLRIENYDDLVTKIPLGLFVPVGYETKISTTNSSADDGGKFSKAHSLKNYIRELRALLSTTPSA